MCFFPLSKLPFASSYVKVDKAAQQESQCSKNGMIVQKINVFANGKPLLQDKNIGKKN